MIAVYILIALIGIFLIYILFSYFLSGTILFLNRQPVPKNPEDYGMSYENAELMASDGVVLKGWLIPGALKRLVVMTHVGGLTKYGSTVKYRNISKLYNKEIEFLKTARHLHEKGYWVLMFDFRNHGESGRSPNGGKAGVGLEEYKDVVAAMDFLKNRDDLKSFDVGFVSFCMGANSTIIAMSKDPNAFQKVKTLVAIQPISMEVFVKTYAKRILSPLGARIIFPMVKRIVNWRSEHPLEKMSPREYAKDLKVPVLYIQARNDPWTDLNDILGFYNNTPGPKEFFWIENTKHRFESYTYFQDNPGKMLDWLNRWM